MRSGPISVWIGRLSAAASRRQSAVSTTQEKSCAVLRMPERAVRKSVFCIFRAMLSIRLERIAVRTPSRARLAVWMFIAVALGWVVGKEGEGAALDPLGPEAPDPHYLSLGFQR